jgi:hypothetical protein
MRWRGEKRTDGTGVLGDSEFKVWYYQKNQGIPSFEVSAALIDAPAVGIRCSMSTGGSVPNNTASLQPMQD